MDKMLSMLLNGAVETLDIAPHLQRLAIERYEEVGSWLAEHGGIRAQVYPQGSFRLGTVVRPNTRTGEYDIDLVFYLLIAKSSTSQAELKRRAGDLLRAYLGWKDREGHTDGPKSCESRRRCWTLTYPDHGFHLDVLPTIPDLEHPPTGILLTDKQLREWQHSNPIGYATWFRGRSEELRRRLSEFARAKHINVDDVPEFEARTTLQRIVQVLKWHCMMSFATDPGNRPPSILITTLAGHAYDGGEDLFLATRDVVARINAFIENRDGVWWVPNPAHEDENFADKWNEYPERREAFFAWLQDIAAALEELGQMSGKGLHVVATRMSERFSAEPVQRAVEAVGAYLRRQREAGSLRMMGTGLLTTSAAPGPRVRAHTFYGQDAGPRG